MKFKALALMAASLLLAGCNNDKYDGMYVLRADTTLLMLDIQGDKARIITTGNIGWRDDARVDVEGEYTLTDNDNSFVITNNDDGRSYTFKAHERDMSKTPIGHDQKTENPNYSYITCLDCSGITQPKIYLNVTVDKFNMVNISRDDLLEQAIEDTKTHDANYAERLSTFEGAKDYEIERGAYNGLSLALSKCTVDAVSESVSPELYIKIVKREKLSESEKNQQENYISALRRSKLTCMFPSRFK